MMGLYVGLAMAITGAAMMSWGIITLIDMYKRDADR